MRRAPASVMRTRSRRLPLGFTLIELLVVVAIMAVVAGVVVPATLSRLQRGQRSSPEEAPAPALAQTPPRLVELDAEGRDLGPARLESSAVALELDARDVLEGLEMRARYRLRFEARLRVRAQSADARALRLEFAFPEGVRQVSAVGLWREGPEGRRAVNGLQTDARGLSWTGTVAAGPGGPAGGPHGAETLVVRYEARGRDGFALDPIPAGEAADLEVELRLPAETRVRLPPEGLEPTARGEGRLAWTYEGLVGGRPIRVALEAGASPLGRRILLFQLAGLGVLLFGAGFWFLSEEDEAGALDDFRFGHFLLLASTFSLFVPAFAVLDGYLGPIGAAALAAVLSLPLLGLHTARVRGRRFALRRGVPLGALIHGGVLLGVQAEAHRPAVALLAGLLVVAGVTWAHRRFVDGRRAHAEARRDRLARARGQAEARRLAELARAQESTLDGAVDAARALLRGREDTIERLDAAAAERAELTRLLARAEALLAEPAAAEPEDGATPETFAAWARRREARGRACAELGAALETAAASARGAIEATRAARLEAERGLVEADRRLAAALAGWPPTEGEPPDLSARRAEAEALRREAGRGLAQAGADAVDRIERLAVALRALERSLETAAEQARRSSGEQHCTRCGAELSPGAQFCGACGTRAPLRLDCEGCGRPTVLPPSRLGRRWDAEPLHCGHCGTRVQAADARPSTAFSTA